jgi:hypothetical protein
MTRTRSQRTAARIDRALLIELSDTLGAIDRVELDGLSHIARARLDYRKWKLIQDFVRRYPVADRPHLKRREQWQDVVDHVRPLNDLEILDWALQQVDIARHHEAGIQDLRPHGSGPCQNLLLRHVSGRKQKANLVLKWALAAEDPDGTTDPDK